MIASGVLRVFDVGPKRGGKLPLVGASARVRQIGGAGDSGTSGSSVLELLVGRKHVHFVVVSRSDAAVV